MKIAICSDIHLEFGGITLDNPENADVLILSGDICVVSDLVEDNHEILTTIGNVRFQEFMDSCSHNFKHVVYVCGNHEHYHGDIATTFIKLKNYLKKYNNVYLLDSECKIIDDVIFVGGTLWTDMNKEDPLTIMSAQNDMNDYRHINYFGKKLTAVDTISFHKDMINYLNIVIDEKTIGSKVVVVGHHAPSKQSTHPRYTDRTINGAYSSNLSDFILDHPQIKLWTHGHTHEDFDYMLGSTRIVCNPRGYDGYEARADRFSLKVVEI